MLIAPALWIDDATGTAVEVNRTLSAVLDPDLIDSIGVVSVEYNPMNDSIDFLIERKRDDLVARYQITRAAIDPASPRIEASHFRADPDQLARLILFLARDRTETPNQEPR